MKSQIFRCVAVVSVLAMAVLSNGCVAEGLSVQAEEGSSQDEDREPTTSASSALESEELLVDVTVVVNRGLFGGKKDYVYPIGGRQITRHEFQVTTRGHADASVQSIDNNEVKVHGWADLYSGYTFTLKVWVAQ